MKDEISIMGNIEREDCPKSERLPTGTLLEDLGCPHCGKTCDVCVTLDEIAADDRQKLRGAVSEVARLECALQQVRARFHESDMRGVRETLDKALDPPTAGGQ